MKRFIALVLSLVMALSLCVPAWGEEVVVSTVDQLKVAAGEITVNSEITINKDVSLYDVTINVGADGMLIAASGATLTLGEGVVIVAEETAVNAEGGTVIIDGADITCSSGTFAAVAATNGGTVTVNAGSSIAAKLSSKLTAVTAVGAGSEVVINGGTLDSELGSTATARDGGKITVEGGTLTALNSRALVAYKEAGLGDKTGGTVVMNDGTVDGIWAYCDSNSSATVNGGTLTWYVGTTHQNYLPAGSLVITGGTFVNDPTEFVDTAKYNVTAEGEKWVVSAKTYTVSFDANGGTGTMADVTGVSGEYTLPACGFTREGYTFVGWSDLSTATEALEGKTYNVEENTTFYAIWEEVPSAPVVPPVEDDKTEEGAVTVTTPAEVDDVVDSTVIDAVKESTETTVTVSTGDTSAKTTIEFNDADAKSAFATATATDISTKLTADAEEVTEEVENTVVEKVGEDAQIATYLDINIEVHVDDEHVGNITQLPEAIKVVIPANALTFGELKDGNTRNVYVLRFHGTQVDRLPATLEANGDVSFYSHLFSTYAVVYEDVATPTNYPIYYWPVGGTTTTPDADETIKSPDTFDAGVALYVGMSVAAAVGTVTLGKKRED